MSPSEIANAKLQLYNEILAMKNVDNAVKDYVRVEREYYTKKLQEIANKKLLAEESKNE